MTYYNFTIKGQINTESIDEAADILEMHMDDLGCIRNAIINIDIKDESITTKKVDNEL